MPNFVKEKIIQISGSLFLTNKGRIFEGYNVNGQFVWSELELPQFSKASHRHILPQAKAQFIDSVTPKERFANAVTITDLF